MNEGFSRPFNSSLPAKPVRATPCRGTGNGVYPASIIISYDRVGEWALPDPLFFITRRDRLSLREGIIPRRNKPALPRQRDRTFS